MPPPLNSNNNSLNNNNNSNTCNNPATAPSLPDLTPATHPTACNHKAEEVPYPVDSTPKWDPDQAITPKCRYFLVALRASFLTEPNSECTIRNNT